MQLQKLTLANDLSLLPAPFYDSKDMQALTLPFVFSARPSPAVLQAAGITASWFGSLASYKGATFPVSFDTVPSGNAVVFATSNEKPAGLNLPGINGPTISVMPNPNNPESKLLLVMGRTPQELSAAAQTLALGSVALSGSTQVVGAPDIPERQAYDAPRWIPMNRPVRFGELVQPTDLQGNGLVPGLLTVNFRTAPDIFVWGNTGIPLDVRYRYPAGTWLNFADSRLDVSINNSYLRSLPLTQEGVVQQVKDIISPDFVLNDQTVRMPPYYIFGQNQLQFYYDLRPMKRGECQDVLPNNVQELIDPGFDDRPVRHRALHDAAEPRLLRQFRLPVHQIRGSEPDRGRDPRPADPGRRAGLSDPDGDDGRFDGFPGRAGQRRATPPGSTRWRTRT